MIKEKENNLTFVNDELNNKLNKYIEHNEELLKELELKKECNKKLKFFNEELIINLNNNVKDNEKYINEIEVEKA